MTRKLLFLDVILLFLLIGVTYAWMTSPEVPEGNAIIYQYGDGANHTIGVQDKELTAQLFAKKSDEEEWVEVVELDELFVSEEFIPSSAIDFKIRLQNTGQKDIHTSISFIGITITDLRTDLVVTSTDVDENSELLDSIMFAMTYADNYPYNYSSVPKGVFKSLSNNLISSNNNQYKFTFLDSVYIPPTGESYVELYCYVMFDYSATIDCANYHITFSNMLIQL